MKRVAFAAIVAACVSICGSAWAADLSLKDTPEYYPAPLPTSWSGFYIGGHAGGAWGDVDISDTYNYSGDPHADNKIDTTGLIAGMQLGYNIQRGNFVYGIEADLGYLNLSDDKTVTLPTAGSLGLKSTYSIDGGLYGDLTGRIGYATDKTLLYVKGGAAVLNADFKSHYVGENCSTKGTCGASNVASNPSVFDFDNSDTLWGWTVGAGVEYALTPNWTLKLEYQHFDFQSMSFDYSGSYQFRGPSHPGFVSNLTDGHIEIDPSVDAVTVGVNYRFNGGAEPLK